jgi:two-component system LytT family sensor kinase
MQDRDAFLNDPVPPLIPARWLRWLLVFGIWTLIGLLDAGQYYALMVYHGREVAWWKALVMGLWDWYIWMLLAPCILRFARRFPLTSRRWPGHLLLHLVAGVFLSTVVVVGDLPALQWLRPPHVQPIGNPELFQRFFLLKIHLYLLVYAAIVGVSHALDYYRKYRDRERRTFQLEGCLAQAQLQVLKMQLHPHFLFNTLNAISALVHQDADLAERMIVRLGDLMRSTLENAGKHEVSLREELQFIGPYLEIEQARLGPRLSVLMDIDPQTLDASVPNLMLQPLVENAIRHGIAPRRNPGRLEIRARRQHGQLHLEVRDNGPGIGRSTPAGSRQGVGLANTRARLQHLYGLAHRFAISNVPEGGLAVTLVLPFRATGEGQSLEAGAALPPAELSPGRGPAALLAVPVAAVGGFPPPDPLR